MTRVKRESVSRIIAPISLVIALFGMSARFWLSGDFRSAVDLLGYFTVLSNLAVIAVLLRAVLPRSRRRTSIGTERTRAAVGLYIVVTGLVYQSLLGPALEARGLNLVVLNINHGLTPLLYFAWYVVRPKPVGLVRRDALRFLTFPAIYGVAAVIEGAIRGHYRYFFLDVGRLGLGGFVLSIVLLGLLFYAGGIGMVALSRR